MAKADWANPTPPASVGLLVACRHRGCIARCRCRALTLKALILMRADVTNVTLSTAAVALRPLLFMMLDSRLLMHWRLTLRRVKTSLLERQRGCSRPQASTSYSLGGLAGPLTALMTLFFTIAATRRPDSGREEYADHYGRHIQD